MLSDFLMFHSKRRAKLGGFEVFYMWLLNRLREEKQKGESMGSEAVIVSESSKS